MLSRIPIVDKTDKIISYKRREELDPQRDIVRSSSVWITNSNDEILLAKRAFDKRTDPGKWAEAVGGMVEEGEDYESTAYREAEEELGIKRVVFALGPKQYISDSSARYFVQWYYAVLDWPIEAFVLQKSEVEQVRWWNARTLESAIQHHPEKYIAPLPEMIALLRQ